MFKYNSQLFLDLNKFTFLLVLLFPIFLIIGNLLINFFYISIAIISIFKLNKKNDFFTSNIFYLLIFFLIYLAINLLFSVNISNSYPRVIKFLLIIFFVKEIFDFNNNKKIYFEKITKFWSILFFVVTIDIIFEIIFGFNTLGFKSYMEGRVASFFGDELVVGSFYHFFSLIVLSFFIKNKKSNVLVISLIILMISTSFMIGERANFIKLFFSILIFVFLTLKINLAKKISLIGLTFLIIGLVFYLNDGLKKRYYNQLSDISSLDGFKKYFKESQYGAHQNTAYEIFKDNILFGVGLKNFREESKKSIYENPDYFKTDERQATHPHQIHLELLSELGIIGYISFFILMTVSIMISIKNYLIYKNPYQLSVLIYILSCLIPLIPSGSLFSTFFGGIFWFSFGLMISFNRNLKLKI